jgi:hypothetical protein
MSSPQATISFIDLLGGRMLGVKHDGFTIKEMQK